jgi:hypothetical protein
MEDTPSARRSIREREPEDLQHARVSKPDGATSSANAEKRAFNQRLKLTGAVIQVPRDMQCFAGGSDSFTYHSTTIDEAPFEESDLHVAHPAGHCRGSDGGQGCILQPAPKTWRSAAVLVARRSEETGRLGLRCCGGTECLCIGGKDFSAGGSLDRRGVRQRLSPGVVSAAHDARLESTLLSRTKIRGWRDPTGQLRHDIRGLGFPVRHETGGWSIPDGPVSGSLPALATRGEDRTWGGHAATQELSDMLPKQSCSRRRRGETVSHYTCALDTRQRSRSSATKMRVEYMSVTLLLFLYYFDN